MMTFDIATSGRDSFTDITSQVKKAITESGIKQGMCVVYCQHTTAAITINENADPAVRRDIIWALDRAFPHDADYHHAEGNAAAHVKSSLVGASAHLLVENGQPVLGTWQSVFFCDFDGPRRRRFMVQVMST